MKIFLLWSELNYSWNNINREGELMIWSDIALIEEVKKIIRGGGLGTPHPDEIKAYIDGNPWKKLSQKLGEEKTEKFIKIFCTINDIEYESKKFIKENIKVEVSQFQKVFEETIKIKVNIQK